MTNIEILEKAVQKAIDGGWGNTLVTSVSETVEIMLLKRLVEAVIFDKSFAKALWGEEDGNLYIEYVDPLTSWNEKYDGAWMTLNSWKYHLQQMVIADDPIKYLGENI